MEKPHHNSVWGTPYRTVGELLFSIDDNGGTNDDSSAGGNGKSISSNERTGPLVEFFYHLRWSHTKSTERGGISETRPTSCMVCSETLTPETLVRSPITSSCDHGDFEGQICRSCLRKHIESKRTGSQSWSRITCWAPGCKAILGYGVIQHYATKKDFTAYDEFLMRQAVEEEGTYRECAYPGCKSGGWFDRKSMTFFTCGACGRSRCISCNRPHHTGKTCAESRAGQRKKADKEDETIALVAKISKKCPNANCGANIQKVSGCDHITCKWTYN